MKPDLVPRAVMRVVVRRSVRPLLHPTVPLGVRRRGLELGGLVGNSPEGTSIDHLRLGDRPTQLVSPSVADAAKAVLFLHGGAYTTCSPFTHRGVAAHLAAASRRAVYLLDYRLAPEHPFPAALDDALAAYRALLAQGIAAADLAVVGDSAGAGLALALALRLRETGVELPGSLGLLCPWVDLALETPAVRDDSADPLLRFDWLERSALQYAGGTPRSHPSLSPLFGDLTGLPRTMVQAGSDEILRGDAERLVERLEAHGVPVHFRLGRDLWHVWHLFAGLMPEATAAVRELGEFVRTTGNTDTSASVG